MHFLRHHLPSIIFGLVAVAILVALYLLVPQGNQISETNGGLGGSGSHITDFPTEPITLNYWRTADGTSPFDDIIKDYHILHPNVTIKLTNLDSTNYDKQLSEAVKANTQPDLFSVNNDWMERYNFTSSSAPESVFTADEFKATFLPVVSNALVKGNQVTGLTYGVSTLGLFYNQTLFEKAGIKAPPTNWQQFLDDSKKLTLREGSGITTSGAALGGVNVDNYTAIVSALMTQNGASMTDDPVSRATFASTDSSGYASGVKALSFYSSFARAGGQNQSWDASAKGAGSLSSFEQGKAAMLIDYVYRAPEIDAANPALKYKMASLPQVSSSKPTNQADFWVELVSNKSKHTEVAWDFLRFASTKTELNRYSIATYRPAARIDLAKDQQNDIYLGPFAKQSTTATTWKKGNNYNTDGVFADMISAALAGGEAQAAVSTAETRVTQEIVRSK